MFICVLAMGFVCDLMKNRIQNGPPNTQRRTLGAPSGAHLALVCNVAAPRRADDDDGDDHDDDDDDVSTRPPGELAGARRVSHRAPRGPL